MKTEDKILFNKIYPWYSGLSMDLLFFIAIDTLFLTSAVGLSSSQILLSTSIALFARLFLQPLLHFIIKKLGNTISIRLGSFLLLVSAMLYTIAQNFIIVLLANIFYELGLFFREMVNVILKNNLEFQGKSTEYAKYTNNSHLIYSIATMLISIVASLMFNISPYFPMCCCVFFTILCLILSFFIKEYDNDSPKSNEKVLLPKPKIKLNRIIVIAIISYMLFYSILTVAQVNEKLFIQEELLTEKTIETTVIIIGIIQLISRIVRVLSDLVFNKLFARFGSKLIIYYSSLLAIAVAFTTFGSFFVNLNLKIAIMSLGFFIYLFIRDHFRVVVQDYIMNKIEKVQRQSVISTMHFGYNLLSAIFSLIFSVILVDFDFALMYIILLALAIIEFVICIVLYKMINSKKKIEEKSPAINC